ncbi:DNA-3-methyladenine glycosylase family protein [Mariniplasma anaerobium]|uniref:DNA-3-methyladenine glycosylase II n=1 Tax=Mariniplasma anaerobium TaxID=2735436 RepID=A0A7U9TJN4_9MOLU|nr:DNA-3-methyladenine glycosylase 2 family protein [Mariniplasma anaerobium]BCR36311.1 3-methyladenine DNA glycosylase [Mariniplasma anaerobium]
MDYEITFKNNSKEVVFLIDKDPNLKSLFENKSEIKVKVSVDYYQSLVQTIIAQQLSTRVADIIYNRLLELLNNQIDPFNILNTSDDQLRDIGLSRPKIKYLKSLAKHIDDKEILFEKFDSMTDEEIINQLTEVKGIGIWTAQMFLMFSMGRKDVFSTLDLGLRNALKQLLNRPEMTHKEIEAYSQKWIPYRSYVSHFLWHSWD